MKGRGLISLFLSLVSINFVSAAYFGSFSLENLFNSIDPSTMVLGVIFIISSLLINTALKRVGVFRDSPSIGGVIAITLALFIVWGVNRSGIDYYGLFNGILFFVPAGMLELVWPIVFLIGTGLLFWKFGFSKTMMILGALMIAGSFFAYDSGIVQIAGAILIGIGFILAIRGYLKRGAIGVGRGGWGATKGLARGAGVGLQGIGKGFKNAKERLNNSTIVDEGLDAAGRGLKKAKGWVGNKYQQRKYNNMRDAAARENSEKDRISTIATRKKDKAHDEAIKENKERDHEATLRENAVKEKQKEVKERALVVKQETVIVKQQKAVERSIEDWQKRGAKIEKIMTRFRHKPNDPRMIKLKNELAKVATEIQRLRSQK